MALAGQRARPFVWTVEAGLIVCVSEMQEPPASNAEMNSEFGGTD